MLEIMERGTNNLRQIEQWETDRNGKLVEATWDSKREKKAHDSADGSC